jgi:UDP-glucose 4-epimerase
MIVRPFNVYGHRQDSRMVIPRMINKAKRNAPLTVYFDGKQTRDFTYIDDFVNCLISLSKKSGFGIYNFARGDQNSIYNLAKIIKKKLNSKSKIKFVNPKKNILDFQVKKRNGNISKFYKDFKYKPKISLEDGLDKIIQILKLKK